MAALGWLAAVVFVVLEGHTHTVPGQVPPSRWFGMLGPVAPYTRAFDALVGWAAILTLGGCWLVLARRAVAGRLGLREAGVDRRRLGGAVRPRAAADQPRPVQLRRARLAVPLRSQPVPVPAERARRLTRAARRRSAVARGAQSVRPGGELRWSARAALVGHTPLGTVIAVRVLGSVAAVLAVVAAVLLTAPTARPRTLVLLGLNPLLLTTTFSAAHLEATMLALLLWALLAFRRHRPVLAIALAVVAGLVKVPALAAVPFFALEHWRSAPSARDRHPDARPATPLTAGVALVAGGLLVPHGWGWTSSVLHTPAIGREWWTPSTLLAEIGVGAAHVAGAARRPCPACSTSPAASACSRPPSLLTWLLFRRGDPALRLGLGLSALAILGFVLYPWYLLWGWPLVVIAGRPSARLRRLAWRRRCSRWPTPGRSDARPTAFLHGTGRHPLTSAVAAPRSRPGSLAAARSASDELLRGRTPGLRGTRGRRGRSGRDRERPDRPTRRRRTAARPTCRRAPVTAKAGLQRTRRKKAPRWPTSTRSPSAPGWARAPSARGRGWSTS